MSEIFNQLQPNYLYLIHDGKHISQNKAIYKIGKTKQLNLKRFKGYPNDSILVFQIICENCDNYETQLIKIFRKKYIWEKEEGKEYFSLKINQTLNDMIRDIYDLVTLKNCQQSYTLHNFDKKEVKELKNKLSNTFKNLENYEKDICLEDYLKFENKINKLNKNLLEKISLLFSKFFKNENNENFEFVDNTNMIILNIFKKVFKFLYDIENPFTESTTGFIWKTKVYSFKNIKIITKSSSLLSILKENEELNKLCEENLYYFIYYFYNKLK